MGIASSIRKNSFFSFLSSSIRLLTNILMFVGIARFYGTEAFGQFTTAHTLATIFLLFADFGLDMILTTEVAREREAAARIFGRFFSIKAITVLVAVVGMWVVPILQHVSGSTHLLIAIFSLYVALTALSNFYFALFKGFEQLQYEAKVSFTNNLILLLVLVTLGFIGAPLYVVAIAFVGTRAIGLITCYRIAARLMPGQSLRLSFGHWREIQSQVLVFGFHLLFGNLFFVLDTILLAFWKGDHDVGIYQSAFRLVTLFLVIPEVIINALMPVLSRFHGENRERWDTLGKLMNKTLLFIGLPIALVLFTYAEQIIHLVYGTSAFAEAVPILQIFGFIVLIRFSVETYALMLTTARRQMTRMTIVILATVLNCMLNFYAIPKYGPLGAAFVSLATNLFVGLGYVVATGKLFVRWTFDFYSIIPFVVTGIIAFILWNVRTISMWYVSPFAVGACLLVSYFLGYTTEERKLVFAKERFW